MGIVSSHDTDHARPGAKAPAWLTGAIAPFLATRALLLLVAWIAHRLPLLKLNERSYATSFWPLDVWGRWDTGWYVDIALNGYRIIGSPLTDQQNTAFYPLYPLSMRAVAALLPAAISRPVAALAAGVLLANVAALGAMLVLHRHVQQRFGEVAARRTIWAMLAFPTAFYFSCAYTEAFFLLLAVVCFHAAWKGRWPLAGISGGLLALCRANGVMVFVPLLVLALEGARSSPWHTTVKRLSWTLLVPLGLLVWWGWLWHLTGDPAAFSRAQGAWGRHFALPWTTLFGMPGVELLDPDRLVLLLACVAVALTFSRLSKADGALAAGFTAPAICSALVTSGARYVLVVFPAFVLVGISTRFRWLWRLALVACLAIQALLFSNWCRGGFID